MMIMVATYCTTAQVYAYLQRQDTNTSTGAILTDFSDTYTIPTQATVTDMIERAEDIIDETMDESYKSNTVTNEYHEIIYPRTHSYFRNHPYIMLQHRQVTTLASGTDKLEIENPRGTWTDWVATKTAGTDYKVDYSQGIIYLLRGYPVIDETMNTRVTYRYGASSVPATIEQLTVLMAARDVLMMDTDNAVHSGGNNGIYRDDAGSIMEKIDREIGRLKKFWREHHRDTRWMIL